MTAKYSMFVIAVLYLVGQYGTMQMHLEKDESIAQMPPMPDGFPMPPNSLSRIARQLPQPPPSPSPPSLNRFVRQAPPKDAPPPPAPIEEFNNIHRQVRRQAPDGSPPPPPPPPGLTYLDNAKALASSSLWYLKKK